MIENFYMLVINKNCLFLCVWVVIMDIKWIYMLKINCFLKDIKIFVYVCCINL